MKKLIFRILQSYFYMVSEIHDKKSKHYMRLFENVYEYLTGDKNEHR